MWARIKRNCRDFDFIFAYDEIIGIKIDVWVLLFVWLERASKQINKMKTINKHDNWIYWNDFHEYKHRHGKNGNQKAEEEKNANSTPNKLSNEVALKIKKQKNWALQPITKFCYYSNWFDSTKSQSKNELVIFLVNGIISWLKSYFFSRCVLIESPHEWD